MADVVMDEAIFEREFKSWMSGKGGDEVRRYILGEFLRDRSGSPTPSPEKRDEAAQQFAAESMEWFDAIKGSSDAIGSKDRDDFADRMPVSSETPTTPKEAARMMADSDQPNTPVYDPVAGQHSRRTDTYMRVKLDAAAQLLKQVIGECASLRGRSVDLSATVDSLSAALASIRSSFDPEENR